VFDYWGQDFISDASPGQNYWATPISGNVEYPAKHAGGSFNDSVNNFKDTALRGRDVYPTFIVKRTRPSAGSELIYTDHFPEDMQGDFLLTNVIGDRSVLQHGMEEQDSGFLGTEKTPLVDGDDGNFRPVDVQIGPDGALYIVDWHNALIGHLQHNLRDPSRDHSHGRIWRVTHKDRPLVTPPKVAGEPIAALLQLLESHEGRHRYAARRELAERDAEDVAAGVKTWLASVDGDDPDAEHHKVEALWALQTHNLVDLKLLKEVLNSPDYHARGAATRVLCGMRHKVPDALALLKERCNDEHPRVRVEAVRACSFFNSEDAMEVALEVLNHDVDQYVQYTLDETMRHLESTL